MERKRKHNREEREVEIKLVRRKGEREKWKVGGVNQVAVL